MQGATLAGEGRHPAGLHRAGSATGQSGRHPAGSPTPAAAGPPTETPVRTPFHPGVTVQLALPLGRRPPPQLDLDQVEERVHLVLVVAAAAYPRLAEGHFVDLVGGHTAPPGAGTQRDRDESQEVVDL